MRRHLILPFATTLICALLIPTAAAQVRWNIGGNMGLGIATSPSSADFTFGPMSEVLFGKGPAVGTEFNITTGTGTPIDWSN
jgi:hypothetical protein